ncbi:hypothetical protein Tco_0620401 [Tanacetum coccineum]
MESDKLIESSVENLVPIPSESKGISDDTCDVPIYDNDHFDAEFGLINSLLSRDILMTSPKIDFLLEEFASELDLIDPILPGIDEDNFDEEEGEIDIDILQIEDEILREKLLNVNLLIDKIEALNHTPSIPFVLEYPSSSPIPVVDSDILIEEVDTFLVSEDSIPSGIKSDFDWEGDIIFLNDLLNDDPIPKYERFTFDIEPDTPVIKKFDELNKDKCFDPGGGEINMTTSVGNNSVFRSFFEKQKLTGPNFIDWYRQLRLVLSTEDKEYYLEHPIPVAPVAPPGQQIPPEDLAAHAAWVKGQKEVAVLMLLTMDLDIQRNLAHLGAYDMLQELKAMFSKQAEQELLQTVREFHTCKQEEGQSVSSHVLTMTFFDQYQPPQFPVIHHSPQATDTKMLQARENLMETIQAFLNEYDHIPSKDKCMALLLAGERFLKIKQAVEEEQNQPEAAQSFLLNWNFPMVDDDEYTIIYRSSKAITPDLPTEEPDNSLSMGDEHLSTILETESEKLIKCSVENLVPIPSDFKGISEDICDVPFCDNDHFDAEFGLINSLLSRDISITSPKIDFLPEEFAGELDLIDPILPGIDEDDFDKEEGEIDINILQIEDEILCEKLLNVNLLIDKIEALKLTPSIPFVLEYPSSSPIPIVDSDFLIEEVDTFLVLEDSIPPGIESDFDSEGDIIFLNDLHNDDPIPKYERFTFDIEPDAPMINNFDKLNKDECFDPGGVRLFFPQMLKMTIPSHFSFGLFSRFSPTLRILLYFSPPRVKTPFLTLASPLRAGGISSG